jgi:hypothetical protein
MTFTGRKLILAAATAAVAALALAPGATALDVRTDHFKGVDFSAYGTYKWVEGNEVRIPVVQAAIESAVRSQLESKGLSEDSGVPGLWVVTHASVDDLLRVDPQEHGYTSRWRSWGPTSVNFRNVEPGTLVIDLVDAKSGDLLWRGIADETFNPKAKKQEKNEKKILKAAELLFEDFPPAE